MEYLNILLDVAFKYLMQDNQIARKILSLILGLEILELELLVQETVRPTDKDETGKHLKLLRMDFKAHVVTQDGQHANVLIELQKDKKASVSWRFRHYLADYYQYLPNDKDEERHGPIPTVAVYLLGFAVFETQYPFVRSRVKYESGFDNKLLPSLKIPNFVSGLSHECVYIHVNGFKNQAAHPMTDLMLMFDQSRKHPKHPEVLVADTTPMSGSLSDLILQRMQDALKDEVLRRTAREEFFEAMDARILADDLQIALVGREEALLREEQARQREKDERRQKEAARQREKDERRQKETILVASVKRFYALGLSVDEIADTLGITTEEVQRILGIE